MKKYIILSVNDNPSYLFYVPLVVWAWRKFGWDPIVFFVGLDNQPPLFGLAFHEQLYINEGWKVFSVPGYKSETIAQVSRLYAACVSDGYLMTTDADMLPLSDYWLPDENKLLVYGRDLTDYHYPICYIGARSAIWSQVMDIQTRDFYEHIKRDLRHQDNMWGLDQDIITEKINNSKFTPERIDRGTDKRTGYPLGRVDRSNWRLDHDVLIDAHLPHDILTNEASFKKVLELLHTVWPKEDWSWWITYTKEFKKLWQNK